MIEIDKIRAVFFDFDDTLAIRSTTRTNEDDESARSRFLEDAAESFTSENPDAIPRSFDLYQRSSAMAVFLDILAALPPQTRPKLFLIGRVPNAAVAECQRRWVLKNYFADLGVFSVASKDEKISTATSVAKSMRIRAEECLVVDDALETLKLAERAWMKSASPLEVAEFSLTYVSKHERFENLTEKETQS